MKKNLRLLALIVASVISGMTMAATDYGITICGTKVTSSNASNITGSWLKSGTIRYDYSSNKLTFDNANIYADGGIYVYNTCKDALHMRFNGINTISTNSVAFSIEKANGYSNVDVYFEGDGEGILNINWHGSGVEKLYDNGIYCYSTNGNYPWVCIGNGTQGGEGTHSALTVNATCISGAGGGSFYITDGVVNLKGYGSSSSYSSIRGFSNVYVNGTGNGIWTEGVSYSSSNKRLEKSGSNYPGAVYAGWQKYGLRICGIEVTYKNKGDIKVPDTDPLNPVLTTNNSTSTAAANGAISYDPDNNRLTLKNVCIWDNHNANRGEAVIDNQTGKDFYILTSSNSTIVRSDGQPCGVRSNSMLTFQGGELLVTGTTANNCKALIVMDGDDLALRFWNSSNTTLEGYSTSAPAVCCAQEGQWLRLETHDCNLSTKGSLKNISKYTPDRTGITNNKVIWDSQCRSFIPWGNTSALVTTVNFARATSYGITIAGLDLNTVTKDNFYCEALKAGSVSYDENNKTVTLNNVQADMSSLSSSTSGININSSAPDKLKLNIVGNNTFTGYNNAVAMVINKETNASLSSVTRYITGTGVLDLGADGSIRLNNQPWICIGNGVQGGEGLGGVTVKASSIYGQSGSSTARLSITDGALELSGKSSGTLYNINTLFCDGMEVTPSNVSFNSSNSRVEKNGSLYTGALRIGWEDYGLTICGTKVTAGNKNDIRITTNVNAQNLVMSRNMSSHLEEAATGAVKYNPGTNTLTLTDVDLADFNNTNYGEAVIDNKTGKAFTIQTSGAVQLNTAFGKQKAVIRSNSDITFKGGQMWFSTADQTSSCLLMDGNHLLATFADGSNTEINGTYGTGEVGSAMDVATSGNKLRVKVGKCNLKMVGSCHNFEYFNFDGSAIQSQGVYVDEDQGKLFKNSNGNVAEHDMITEIVPYTKTYGITVGGHSLNDINKDNFYYADVTGSVTYDPDEKTLSLNSVTAGCKRKIIVDGVVKDNYWNGLNVNSSAPDELTINLQGSNKFNDIDGVGMAVYKNTTICGYGNLWLFALNAKQAPIYLYDEADLTLVEQIGVMASQLVGSDGKGGTLKFMKANYDKGAALWLVGDGATATVRGIKGILDDGIFLSVADYGEKITRIVAPNGGWYDSSDTKSLRKRAVDGGSVQTGNVLIGPTTFYGISINDVPVTSWNYDDILADTEIEYSGKLSYDPDSHTLTMDNLKTESGPSVGGITIWSVPDEDSWTYINLIGENEWTNPNYLYIMAGNVQFYGNGSLTYPEDIVLSRDEYELATPTGDKSEGRISISDCTINANSIYSQVGVLRGHVNGSLDINNATITLNGNSHSRFGTINGFAEEPELYDTSIHTPAGASWCDETDNQGNRYAYLTADGSNMYRGEVIIYPSYGIYVAGTEVTAMNKDDVLGDGGSVKFTPSNYDYDYEEDPMGWMPHLILNRANINGNIVMQDNGGQSDEIVLQLIDDNTINAGRSTGIQSERSFTVWSKNAYGKLYVKGTGSGVELTNNRDMTVANAELNINVGTYGIKGQCTGEDPTGTYNELGGYESVRVLSNNPYGSPDGTGTGSGELYYSKLVVKNGNRNYPLVSALYDFYFEDCAVMEPTRAYFDREKYAFVGSNGTTLTNTTLVISNADYNTVGIEEVEKDELLNAGDVYDLSGRKMNNTRIQRGIYVVNGKKVAVK